jgi:hypothetical protein
VNDLRQSHVFKGFSTEGGWGYKKAAPNDRFKLGLATGRTPQLAKK